MTITKEEQVEQRRAKVLELTSQGLTQQEISNTLVTVSQKTVSNDLAWLRQDAIESIRNNREDLAFEYKQAKSNLYQLRKEAWKHFQSTQNEAIKTHLYSIIVDITNNITVLSAAGDMIQVELVSIKEHTNTLKEDMMKEALDQSTNDQAIF